MVRAKNKEKKFPFLIFTVILAAFFLSPLTALGAEEPKYEVNFNFGSVGINADVYDSSTGEKIPKDKVNFKAYPADAGSVNEINKIKVTAPGYQAKYVSSFTKFSISMGFIQMVVIKIGRVRLPPKQPPELTVYSSPSGASVYVDGSYRGKTPKRNIKLDPGSHEIRLKESGYYSWSDRVYIDTGEQKTISSNNATLRKKNTPPSADFSFYPDNPSTEDEVNFRNQATDEDGRITDYRWTFGDGSRSWGKTVSHTFDKEDTYRVKLKVTDDDGATDTARRRITVSKANKPPRASFTYSPKRPKTDQEVTFNSDSSDPDYNIHQYKWSFGDGSVSYSEDPNNTFSEPGTYTVALKVTDEEGASDSTTKRVVVENEKPKADLSFSPKEPKVGKEITFDASSSTDEDGSIERYKWDLTGNGEVDRSGSKVTYTYDKKGNFEVELTVVDDSGGKALDSREVKVAGKPEDVDIDEKYALVIGISDYKYDSVRDLKYAREDAESFKRFLVSDKYENLPEGNVKLLTDAKATTQNIGEEMRWLVTEADKDDLIIIYFSGHGYYGEDHNGDEEEDDTDEYFITYDTDANNLYSTGIRDDQFGDWLKSMDSKQVAIFLDSCYSGGATKSAKTLPTSGKGGGPETVFNDFDFENRLLFAASEENQEAQESKKFDQGVFTHFLLEGLKGKADKNKDGKITSDELYDYLNPRISNYVEENIPKARTDQTPMMKGAIGTPLAEKSGEFVGEVIEVKGDQKKANKGEYVVMNIGEKDGVKLDDKFKVLYSSKGVGVIEKLNTEIKITDVVGPHYAVGKVLSSELDVKEGYRVRRVEEE